MITLNLNPIFKARGIEKPYSFLVKAGFSPHSATNILNSQTRIFRLDHIEKLCDILLCEPNDLLKWTPNNKQKYADSYPLLKLKQENSENLLKETLDKMPFKQLQQVTKEFMEKNNMTNK